MEFETKIQEIIDRSEITQVLNNYFKALDEKTFDLEHFATFLRPDATMTRPNGASLTGPDTISASHEKSFSRFESSQHLLTGHDISITGTEATVRANLVAMHMWDNSRTNANERDNFFVAGGVVNATLKSEQGQWRIAELSNSVIWRAGGFKDMLQTSATESG